MYDYFLRRALWANLRVSEIKKLLCECNRSYFRGELSDQEVHVLRIALAAKMPIGN